MKPKEMETKGEKAVKDAENEAALILGYRARSACEIEKRLEKKGNGSRSPLGR